MTGHPPSSPLFPTPPLSRPRAGEAAGPAPPPARGALAGPVRQHGEAVARRRQRRERRLDLVVARQLQHLPTPRVDVASLGRRPTEQRPTAVEPVAPETARRLERSGGHDP